MKGEVLGSEHMVNGGTAQQIVQGPGSIPPGAEQVGEQQAAGDNPDLSVPQEFMTNGLPQGADKRVKGALAKFQAAETARKAAEQKAQELEQRLARFEGEINVLRSAVTKPQEQRREEVPAEWVPPPVPQSMTIPEESKAFMDYMLQVLDSKAQFQQQQLLGALKPHLERINGADEQVQALRSQQIVRDVNGLIDQKVSLYPEAQREFIAKQLRRGIATTFQNVEGSVPMEQVAKVIDADLAEMAKFIPRPAAKKPSPFAGLDGDTNQPRAPWMGVPGQHTTGAPELPPPNSLDELMARTGDFVRGAMQSEHWTKGL